MKQLICRDQMILSQKATPATPADVSIAQDLSDTLRANLTRCVGMAANMIGRPKCIISIALGDIVLTMINPKIISKSGAYSVEEGCLSLDGTRPTTRYRHIEVSWQDTSFQFHKAAFDDFPAQIIQHEMDHLNGILI